MGDLHGLYIYISLYNVQHGFLQHGFNKAPGTVGSSLTNPSSMARGKNYGGKPWFFPAKFPWNLVIFSLPQPQPGVSTTEPVIIDPSNLGTWQVVHYMFTGGIFSFFVMNYRIWIAGYDEFLVSKS